jgi:hypothetical protein
MSSNDATPKSGSGETPKPGSGETPKPGSGETANIGRDSRGRWMKDVRSPDQRFGRPRGARNKLAENFLGDLAKLWEEQGEDVLRRAAFNEPMKFADMVARLLPAKIEIKSETLLDVAVSRLDDDRLADLLEAFQAARDGGERAGVRAQIIDVTPIASETSPPRIAPAPDELPEPSVPQIAAALEPPNASPVVEPLDPFAEFESQLAREARHARGGDDGSV